MSTWQTESSLAVQGACETAEVIRALTEHMRWMDTIAPADATGQLHREMQSREMQTVLVEVARAYVEVARAYAESLALPDDQDMRVMEEVYRRLHAREGEDDAAGG